jgi:hypothetical protein
MRIELSACLVPPPALRRLFEQPESDPIAA